MSLCEQAFFLTVSQMSDKKTNMQELSGKIEDKTFNNLLEFLDNFRKHNLKRYSSV